MLVFWISAPVFGLITAILFGLAELGLLAGTVSFLNFAVCKRLSSRQSVQVRKYRRWVLAASLFSILAFVLVETILSLSSDPSKGELFEENECLRSLVGSGEDDDGAEAEAIQFECTEVRGTNVIHRTGNFSLKTEAVRCNEVGYYYEIRQRVRYKQSLGKPVRRCTKGICAATIWRNDTPSTVSSSPDRGTLYISDQVSKTTENRRLLLMPTHIVSVDLSIVLGAVSKRASALYLSGITEEGELRRRALLGTAKENCLFVRKEVDITEVTTWALAFSVATWAASIIIFVITLFLRRKIFFDMGNPLHWATATRHDKARPYGPFPSVSLDENGQGVIWVTEFSKNGDLCNEDISVQDQQFTASSGQ